MDRAKRKSVFVTPSSSSSSPANKKNNSPTKRRSMVFGFWNANSSSNGQNPEKPNISYTPPPVSSSSELIQAVQLSPNSKQRNTKKFIEPAQLLPNITILFEDEKVLRANIEQYQKVFNDLFNEELKNDLATVASASQYGLPCNTLQQAYQSITKGITLFCKGLDEQTNIEIFKIGLRKKILSKLAIVDDNNVNISFQSVDVKYVPSKQFVALVSVTYLENNVWEGFILIEDRTQKYLKDITCFTAIDLINHGIAGLKKYFSDAVISLIDLWIKKIKIDSDTLYLGKKIINQSAFSLQDSPNQLITMTDERTDIFLTQEEFEQGHKAILNELKVTQENELLLQKSFADNPQIESYFSFTAAQAHCQVILKNYHEALFTKKIADLLRSDLFYQYDIKDGPEVNILIQIIEGAALTIKGEYHTLWISIKEEEMLFEGIVIAKNYPQNPQIHWHISKENIAKTSEKLLTATFTPDLVAFIKKDHMNVEDLLHVAVFV